jgi:hypothetical protein
MIVKDGKYCLGPVSETLRDEVRGEKRWNEETSQVTIIQLARMSI